MDSYKQYEQDCERIRKDNEKIINDFESWLSDKDLSKKTIANHCNNLDFYINEFLLYEEAIEASDGIYEIGYFLGFWFIKRLCGLVSQPLKIMQQVSRNSMNLCLRRKKLIRKIILN